MKSRVGIVVGLLISLFAVWGYFYMPVIFGDNRSLWIVCFIIGLVVFFTSFRKKI